MKRLFKTIVGSSNM